MRKVLFSFLGRGDYKPCVYAYDGKSMTKTRFIQTAIYEGTKAENQLDMMVIFTTREAKEQNWEDHFDARKNERLEGLKNALSRITPDAKVKLVDISSEQDEAANWALFDAILAQIEEGDEIYFDITHSLRSIPVIALIALNYATLIKKAEIKKLMYGWFDPQQPEKIAPIIDMSKMLTLLKWTNGVDQFIRTGDASVICELTETENRETRLDDTLTIEEKNSVLPLKKMADQLNKVSLSFQTCRSEDITKNIQDLRSRLSAARDSQTDRMKPLLPLLTGIESKYRDFDDDKILNGLKAAKWCADHHLVQQGFTLLQENLTTGICRAFDLDYSAINQRQCVNSAILILLKETPREDWKFDSKTQKRRVEKLYTELQPYKKLLSPFGAITDYRNDLNHGGTTAKDKAKHKPKHKAKDFERKLKEYIDKTTPLFQTLSDLVNRKKGIS